MEQTFILNFLTQYKLWILAGVPEQNQYGFSADVALCGNILRYTHNVLANVDVAYGDFQEIKYGFYDLLGTMLFADGLEKRYPFGQEAFMRDCESKSHHLNEDRLEWIRLKLELPYNQTTTEV